MRKSNYWSIYHFDSKSFDLWAQKKWWWFSYALTHSSSYVRSTIALDHQRNHYKYAHFTSSVLCLLIFVAFIVFILGRCKQNGVIFCFQLTVFGGFQCFFSSSSSTCAAISCGAPILRCASLYKWKQQFNTLYAWACVVVVFVFPGFNRNRVYCRSVAGKPLSSKMNGWNWKFKWIYKMCT